MKAVSGKRLSRLLEFHGWRLARIRGSHHIYTKQGTDVRISVLFTETPISNADCRGIS